MRLIVGNIIAILFSINARLNEIYNTMQELISSYNVHQLIIQVTQAVCYMHGKNPIVVHYDLKPRNVLVCNIDLIATVTTMSLFLSLNLVATIF